MDVRVTRGESLGKVSGGARTDQNHRSAGVSHRPGEGQRRRRNPGLRGQCLQLDQPTLGFRLKVDVLVGWQELKTRTLLNALAMFACQKAGAERAIGHDVNGVVAAVLRHGAIDCSYGEVVIVLDCTERDAAGTRKCVMQRLNLRLLYVAGAH